MVIAVRLTVLPSMHALVEHQLAPGDSTEDLIRNAVEVKKEAHAASRPLK